MYINLKDKGISKALFVYGTREKDQIYIIENNLFRGSKILDIGANIGYYVILESHIIGPSAKIIAYEPSEENCLLLRKNVALNNLVNKVDINNAAVSNKSGINRFYLSDKSNLHTLNPVLYKGGVKKAEQQKSIDVATVDIYEIINKHKDIKFVRMDIEGHEVEVLEGLTKAAEDFNVYPDILFETHFPKYDSTHHDIGNRLKRLFELGYFPKVLTSTDERISKLRQRGYEPHITIDTDRVTRGIYEGVSKEDTLDFICNIGGVRAVLLKKG
jgi:FkbM family methyltransferase